MTVTTRRQAGYHEYEATVAIRQFAADWKPGDDVVISTISARRIIFGTITDIDFDECYALVASHATGQTYRIRPAIIGWIREAGTL